MILVYIFSGIIGLYIILTLLGRRYRNPYKLIMVFGKKGSGKSTTLVKLALRYHKRGWNIYSTEPTPYSYLIKPEQIGFIQLMPHSILLVDEVGMIWDNRNYKQFRPEVRDFFKLQRHYKVRCYLFSQTFDIDKKLRDLTDQMYLMVSAFNLFSYGKRISRKIVLTKSNADRPSTISEDLVFDSIIWFWAGSRFFTYIPRYAKYFDSFAAPNLKIVELPYNTPRIGEKRTRLVRKLDFKRCLRKVFRKRK